MLSQIRQALAEGGTVVVRVPNMSNVLASFGRYGDATHVTGYTEYSLMQVLDQAGFENHHIVESGRIGIRRCARGRHGGVWVFDLA